MLYVLFILLVFAVGTTNICLGLVASNKAEKEQDDAEFVFKRGPRTS